MSTYLSERAKCCKPELAITLPLEVSFFFSVLCVLDAEISIVKDDAGEIGLKTPHITLNASVFSPDRSILSAFVRSSAEDVELVADHVVGWRLKNIVPH